MILSGYWLNLPESWDISNVRATLGFLINLLCTAGLWVFAYSSWKHGAMRAAKRSITGLLSLLSVNTLGDVLDTLPLLHLDVSLGVLAMILFQCVVVVVLSVAAIVSGPIARYSTRVGTNIEQTAVLGWLATQNLTSIYNAVVKWNSTISRLNSAQFPYNQLLDFLPNNEVDWVYREAEWNSSWLSNCSRVERTPIALNATGGDGTGDLFDTTEGLFAAFPSEDFVRENGVSTNWGGSFQDGLLQDAFGFIVVQTDPSIAFDKTTGLSTNYLPLNITLAAIHMHNVPASRDEYGDRIFGVGPIEASWYTRAACELHRSPSSIPAGVDPGENWHVAFPWPLSIGSVSSALSVYHYANLVEQSFTRQPIYHPTGQDLFRFYQAYTVSKDTQYHQTVTRSLSAVRPTVELAVPALAVLLCYVFLVCLAVFWALAVQRLPRGVSIPRTKVQWMMQGLREAGGREVDVTYLEKSWVELRSDLRGALYGEAVGPLGRKYRTIRVEVKDQDSYELK